MQTSKVWVGSSGLGMEAQSVQGNPQTWSELGTFLAASWSRRLAASDAGPAFQATDRQGALVEMLWLTTNRATNSQLRETWGDLLIPRVS